MAKASQGASQRSSVQPSRAVAYVPVRSTPVVVFALVRLPGREVHPLSVWGARWTDEERNVFREMQSPVVASLPRTLPAGLLIVAIEWGYAEVFLNDAEESALETQLRSALTALYTPTAACYVPLATRRQQDVGEFVADAVYISAARILTSAETTWPTFIETLDLPLALRGRAWYGKLRETGDASTLRVLRSEAERALREKSEKEQKPNPEKSLGDRFEGAIVEILRELPDELHKAAELTTAFQHQLRGAIAARLQPLLQKQVEALPHHSLEEKQVLCRQVNSLLKNQGLAIRCPKTGRPAILLADLKSAASGLSRFRLEIRDANGQKARTWSSADLPPLELMEDEPRREPLMQWTSDHVTKKRSEPPQVG